MAKYCCKTCGAELYFNPKSGKLHCDYCGSDFDPSEYAYTPEPDGEAGAAKDQTIAQPGNEENGKDAAATDQKSTDDSAGELLVYKCPNCGAEVITSKETAATTCVYCNRAITLEGNLSGVFKPDYVIPFTKEKKDVEAAYQALCKKSLLTPRLFSKQSTIKKIKGMYIPYWLYSFDGDTDMEVLGKNIRVWTTGDTEFTEVSSYKVTEEAHGSFKFIPADALKNMDNTLMDSIEPFDFSKMVSFNPAYLAGFYTQRWDDDSQTNESRAKNRAKESLTQAALQNIDHFDEMHIQSESFKWTNDRADYAMMPVWMMYTEYKGKNYIFGMNGQTGKIMGTIPKDPWKIAKIAGIVFIISQLIMMLLRVMGVL